MKLLSDRLSERAISLGGTVSGEHGVGIGKIKFLMVCSFAHLSSFFFGSVCFFLTATTERTWRGTYSGPVEN